MNRIILSCMLFPLLLCAQQRASDRLTVDLTIYNQDIALVREERTVTLGNGITTVLVPDIPATIDGTSLHCASLTAPNDVKVLEQNYQYDMIHQAKLLEKYVGKEIEFVRVDPTTNKETIVKGKLLATGWTQQSGSYGGYTATGSMIAEINGKIEIAPAGRILLPSLPEGLVLKPQLQWILSAKKAGTHTLEISYLAQRINWECTYVALLDENDAKLDLTGWVTITNYSGSRFVNAGLKLVAGDLNLVKELDRPRLGAMAMKMDVVQEASFQQRELFEYKLYALQRRTDLNAYETKQIELVAARGVTASKQFVYDGLSTDWKWWRNNYSYREQGSFGQQSNTKVGVYVIVKNSEEHNLGIPLPKGKVRVYKRDVDKKEQFIGEDYIDHTPKNEEVRLYLGNAFDLVGKRAQKDFKVVVPGHVVEETIEVTLKNHKDEPVTIVVYEHPWRWQEWSIVRSNERWTKVDQSTIRCALEVAPGEERVVSITIRYRW